MTAPDWKTYEMAEGILQAAGERGFVVVEGETGSGKTTVAPGVVLRTLMTTYQKVPVGIVVFMNKVVEQKMFTAMRKRTCVKTVS